jgi:hypothetical protein
MKEKNPKGTANFLSRNGRYFKGILIAATAALIFCLVLDYRGPKTIQLHSDHVFGLSCFRAKDLIVQDYDQNKDLWATRGMIIYKLKNGDDKFVKVAHVPTGLTVFWLRNFSILRRLTLRPECMEIVPAENGDICALSAGIIWYRSGKEKKFSNALALSHYSFGDQGIRNDGIVRTNDSTLFFGEYFRNSGRIQVRIFKSMNNGRSWETAYAFLPGQVRHIHALQNDPYSEKKWVCTGDLDHESRVAWSDDDYKTIQTLGQGSQMWRVCQLVFTEDAVYWGADAGDENLSGIYRWNRENKQTKKLLKVDGAVFFGTRLANGTIIMSTDRENMDNEKDDRTRLYIITKDSTITQIDCGTWNHHKPGFWFKFAMLRLQRSQGGPSLAISCLNQKELADGDLIIVPEEELKMKARSKGLAQ